MVSLMVALSPHAEEQEFYAFKFWQGVVQGHPPEACRKASGQRRLSAMILLPAKARNRGQIRTETLSCRRKRGL